MRKEKYTFCRNLSLFIYNASFSLPVSLPSCLCATPRAFPVHYWVFPAALSCAWHVGSQRRGSTGSNWCWLGSAKRCPQERPFSSQQPLMLTPTPSSPSPRTTLSISHKAPACRCCLPSSLTTCHEASCWWSSQKGSSLSRSAFPHGWMWTFSSSAWVVKKLSAYSVSWVCPESRRVFLGVSQKQALGFIALLSLWISKPLRVKEFQQLPQWVNK